VIAITVDQLAEPALEGAGIRAVQYQDNAQAMRDVRNLLARDGPAVATVSSDEPANPGERLGGV